MNKSFSIINPFIHSRALTSKEFLGREPELRRLFSRLVNSQPVAIIAPPRTGKTSLLDFLLSPDVQSAYTGDGLRGALFCLLDAQALRDVKTQADFWAQALTPLAQALERSEMAGLRLMTLALQNARDKQFEREKLEDLFRDLAANGGRMVLLLDEFDALLSHPVLNSAEFYGGLRSLASRSPGFTLVLASRHSLSDLNIRTQEMNPTGSPFFNVFTTLRLGALTEDAFTSLLNRGHDWLAAPDREYVSAVSGRQPYLGQAAASMLWEAQADGRVGQDRYLQASRALQGEVEQHFVETWRFWPNATRRAVTAVALADIPRLLNGHHFAVDQMVSRLEDYDAELRDLETEGLLCQTNEGWTIQQNVFLWWLTDELRRSVRDDTALNDWLRAQEMDMMFTHQERETIGKAVKSVLGAAGKGASSLIEGLAKGIGEGAAKAVHLGG